ncbi:unnamed protein product [Symbiodinium sp. KB8]|nr:unnamed protein product [Symbiodinium sp. KB8]
MFVRGVSQLFLGTNFLRVSLVCVVTLVLTTLIGEILILSADLFMAGIGDKDDDGEVAINVVPSHSEPLQPVHVQSVETPSDLEMLRKGSTLSRVSVRRSSFGYAYSEECSLEREKDRWSHMSAPPQAERLRVEGLFGLRETTSGFRSDDKGGGGFRVQGSVWDIASH